MKVSFLSIFRPGFAAALLAVSAVTSHAAEPKKVLVVSTTTAFRHSAIGIGEKTLQKLADESKDFVIVDYARQPENTPPKKPDAPKKPAALKPDASDADKAKFEADTAKFSANQAKYEEALAKYNSDETNQKAIAEFDASMKKVLEKLSPDNLKNYDGVIFLSTTGDLPLPDRDALIAWVKAGHAFIGIHAGSDTFHGFPAYIDMLGGEFRTHGAQVPADIHVKDKNNPATKSLPEVWNLQQEEMYQFKNFDPAKVHELLSMDHNPNDKEKTGLFPVSWIKKFGMGNVFYTSLGHREDLWDDNPAMPNRVNSPEVAKQFQQHVLGGIRWALGLEPGDATPGK